MRADKIEGPDRWFVFDVERLNSDRLVEKPLRAAQSFGRRAARPKPNVAPAASEP